MAKVRFYDWWIYRLFYWRWGKLLRENKPMRDFFKRVLDEFEAHESTKNARNEHDA